MVFFKMLGVTKGKGRKHSNIEEAKETREPNAMPDIKWTVNQGHQDFL